MMFLWSVGCSKDASEPHPSEPGGILATALTAVEGSFPTLFEEVPQEQSGISWNLEWADPGSHIKQFLLLNPVGGICTGDYDGDGRPDFYATSPSNGGRLFRNLGSFQFEDVSEQARVLDASHWGTGATFADVDNDGDLDLYVCGYACPNRLYVNQGDGTFKEEAATFGLDYNGGSMTMAFADADGDGDLDAYLATTGIPPGPGEEFRVQMVPREDGVEVPVIPDRLKEFWGLIYLPGDKATRVEAAQYDRFFRNETKDGSSRFHDASKTVGIDGPHFTLSATWWDFDEDRRPDLYVSNDFTGADALYHNKGDGEFEDVVADVVPHTPWFSMGSDIADLNNDGRVDLFATDMAATSHYREKVTMGNMDDMGWFLEHPTPRQYMRNAIYLNTGTGRMLEGAFLTGLASTDWTWTPRLEDFDNDGLVDVFITNGNLRDTMNSDLTNYAENALKPGSKEYADFWVAQAMRKETNLAFKNKGELKFVPSGKDWGLDRHGVSFGAATADFDGDGDVDLVVSNADQPVSVYQNHSRGNRIKVALRGTASNHFGLGATVRMETASGQKQVRYLTLARGWLSSSDPVLYFGLGEEKSVAKLVVEWPSGHTQEFENLDVNRLFSITEPSGRPKASEREGAPALFQQSSVLAEVRHEEEPYDDFARQPLLPNKLSQLGPATSWADIDSDGDDDFFIGGAKGHAARIFRNDGDGRFQDTPQPGIVSHKYSEDMGGVFFDADSDGDLDLYVVSGGVECEPQDVLLQDRLYLNEDGKGTFVSAPAGAVPDHRESGSVVCAADFDRDGDTDLFVGSRSVPGRFPETPRSHLLRNEGGQFAAVEDSLAPGLGDTGLVTGAVWSDANGDGWIDLLVTHEWGPVKLYLNDEGKLNDATRAAGIDTLTGFWNGIAGADVDNDGDIDYAVTNLGLNTKYKASAKAPELLYYGSLGGSRQPRLIEAKFEDGTCYPRRGFSCSSHAMPMLKDKLKTFHNFASATLNELYNSANLSRSLKLEATTLESGILRNDGTGRFEFKPFPRLAQIAPSFGVVMAELTGDGAVDVCLAQNFFGPQRETGRMDGGLSLLLAGNGDGTFVPIWPKESGIVVEGDAKSLTLADVNGDAAPDLIFGVNDGALRAYENTAQAKWRPVRLQSKSGSLSGTRIEIMRDGALQRIIELSSGSGYLSQSSTVFIAAGVKHLTIRWPDGANSDHGVGDTTIRQP